jgi:hypothetical protein
MSVVWKYALDIADGEEIERRRERRGADV